MDRKEAIEVVKKNWPDGRIMLSEALETLIPELKESEYEKIRKEIISNFNEMIDNIRSEEIIPHESKVLIGKMQKWIAWLEKQREKSNEYQPHQGDPNNPYDMSFEDAQHYTIERGINIPINDGDVFVDERYMTQAIGNIIRWTDEHPKLEK